MADSILDFFYGLVWDSIDLLPDSPFQAGIMMLEASPFADVMGYINYFLPIGMMLNILTVYLVAVSAWYIVRYALRLAQFID